MILAEKIIRLRKKHNLSQEELAERLNVSRQSVSKWEGAKAIPEMAKIVEMSKVFHVSTDYLLRDDIEEEDAASGPVYDEPREPVRRVDMEAANRFLDTNARQAPKLGAGVATFILSPLGVMLIGVYLATRTADENFYIFGVIATLVVVALGIMQMIRLGSIMEPFEYLEKEYIETAYGVDGMVRKHQEDFRPRYTRELSAGIGLLVLAAMPILLLSLSGNDLYVGPAVSLTLLFVAIGVYLIVHASAIQGGFQMLLEEGDYSRSAKRFAKKSAHLTTAYFLALTAIYLAWSFMTNRWEISWVVWPIGAILYAVIMALYRQSLDDE